MRILYGIKTKAVVYTIIPVIISFCIIFSILFMSLFNAHQNAAKAEFRNIVRKNTTLFENKISNVIDYLAFVSSIVEFQISTNRMDREALQTMVSNIFKNNPAIDGSSIYFEPDMYDGKDAQYRGTQFGTAHSGRICFYYYRINGTTSFLPEALENDVEFSQPHYLDVKELNAPIYTDPVEFDIEGEKIFMFIIVYPIRGINGEFIGAITADIHLKEIYEQIQLEKIYKTGNIIITNDNGKLIYHPNFNNIGKSREEAGLNRSILITPPPAASEQVREAARLNTSLDPMTEGFEIIQVRSVLNNKETLISRETIYFPQLDSRFYFAVIVPIDEINAEGNRLLIIVIALSIVVLVLITFILYYIIGNTAKPLIEFTELANRIAQGNYHIRIKGDYQDEFKVLKDAVNLMTNRIEEQMDESQKSLKILKNILNGINALIYVTIPESGKILFINDTMRKVFNLKEEEGIGEYCYKLFRHIDEKCAFCPCFELDKDPSKVITWEEKVELLGRDISHTDCYIDWIGGAKVHLQYAFDITDVKTITQEKLLAEREAEELAHKKEQAEETSRMKSVFLASMSHEIRTPMHGIIGFSELALDDNISIKTRNYLTKIKASAESLLLIINDILDVSKIEAGKMELEKIPFDVSEVFKLCRLISSPKAREKGLTLFCYAEPSVGRTLLGDPTRLRQILLNLLSNAIKFTNNGMVKLLCAITGKTENTITMHFEVKDSGIGMTENQLGKVFNPFTQADDSTTRKFGGTGLGLTITKSFVELMGGVLNVESTFGLGSRFSFELLFNTIDSATNASRAAASVNVDEKPIFSGEVLVCEDNTLNQMVISDHLLKVGLKSVIAANGKIGVDLVKKRVKNNEKPFDLIFMDIHMPELDGLEAAKQIFEIDIKTPIIALTANIMTNDRETYIKAGMCDCLPKPFVAYELWSCLLKYLHPVSMSVIKKEVDFAEEEEQKMELITAFVNGNKSAYKDLNDAIEEGNKKLAHRIAHTLKGVAGIVGQTKLSNAAQTVEQTLAGENLELLNKQMKTLEVELNAALRELTPIAEGYAEKIKVQHVNGFLDKDNALRVLDILDGLLEEDSFDCLNHLIDLRSIPGAEQLINQVENMKFKQARETLAALRKQVESGYGE